MSPSGGQSQKNLSCVACQQRKVKCDRNSPCSSCVKHQVTCIPVTQARQRRRRFPERDLLDRLRAYESLLRRHQIDFEPLHGEELPVVKSSPAGSTHVLQQNTPSPSVATTTGSEPGITFKYQNHTTAQDREGSSESHDSTDFLDDVVRQRAVRQAWEGLFENDNYVLFGLNPGMDNVDRSSLHPPIFQILRLWQAYLDKINPLFKVVHAPSVQGRIIEAAADLKDIEPRLEALMFGIYCVATCAMSDEECATILGTPKKDALRRFQLGGQRSLLNCRFLQTSDRDTLTAFFLYLCSLRPVTDPMSLSPMIGIAVRIAQRMAIHKESALARCSVFEAEMRRRLWWALVNFDTRISQLSCNSGNVILNPMWDCRLPMNVNDSDLRPDMTEPPRLQGKGTDAVFVVTRAELGEYIRNSPYYLEWAEPALKPLARQLSDADLPAFERRLEDEYIRHLDQGNPLHFMATWSTREHIAKVYILARLKNVAAPASDLDDEACMARAFRVLECDTRLSSSPLTVGFRWFLQYHFPFPAYIVIVHQLRRTPTGPLADRAWEAMYESYQARFGHLKADEHPMMKIFAQVIFKAWDVLQAATAEAGVAAVKPRIIEAMEAKIEESERSRGLAEAAPLEGRGGVQTANVDAIGVNAQDYMPMDLSGIGGMGFRGGFEEFLWMGAPSYLLGDMIGTEGFGNLDMGLADPASST